MTNFRKIIEMRISAYLIAPDAISRETNGFSIIAPDIVNDIESIYRETEGFSQDRISCFQISTDTDLDLLHEIPYF